MELFDHFADREAQAGRPLAERMRPRSLAEFIGQRRAVGEGSLVRLAIEQDRIFSMILWGPPGCGKTTLARLIAAETRAHFIHFSAVLSGVKEIRGVIEEAREQRRLHRRRTVLFVDEIHRFNKSQQDAFLPHVESGLITLIGATTENPSFEVIGPLLSRARVFVLEPLSPAHLETILRRALADPQRGLGGRGLTIDDDALALLAVQADGDARRALNALEAAAALAGPAGRITATLAREALQLRVARYDKGGEEHYNLISALHKAVRGSDPHAALYWLARMLEGGEDPLYIARRLVRMAIEDIGLADPDALRITIAARDAYHFLGSPEGDLALAEAAVYLATAPKSNRLYTAMGAARQAARETPAEPVPLHIRNAPTRLLEELGYGAGYRYAFESEDHYTPQEYLPEPLRGRTFYHPSRFGFEQRIAERLAWWEERKRAAGTAQGPEPPAPAPPGRGTSTPRGGSDAQDAPAEGEPPGDRTRARPPGRHRPTEEG